MNTLRYGLLAFIVASLPGSPCSAQQPSRQAPIWAEWKDERAERYGPDKATGALLFFHGSDPVSGPSMVAHRPILPLFAEMAETAKWDILRINRLAHSDHAIDDGRILQFAAEQVAWVRRHGYKRVFVAGASRGGWLALSSARLPGVDGVVGLIPDTADLVPASPDRQFDDLARRVSDAKAKRVAVFLLDGDSREHAQNGRGAILRNALERTTSRFMIVDRPPGLLAPFAVGEGRLARRYRDCLLEFLLSGAVGPGEDACATANGYATGAELDFPNGEPLMSLPFGADSGFAPFLGRWEGDDRWGAYVIAQSLAADAKSLTFLYGLSPNPPARTKPWIREFTFRFDRDRARIVWEGSPPGSVFAFSPLSADVLEHDLQSSPNNVWKFLLRKVNSSRKR
jgi:hypothetical protein